MSQENVDLVLESIRRFKPGGLDEWAEPAGSPETGPFISLPRD
jgi:hypothetical protein